MKRNKANNFKLKKNITEYLFVAPSFLIIFTFFALPVLLTLALSFTDWSALDFTSNFVGLKNYKEVFEEKFIWQVIGNTLKLVILYVPMLNIFSIVIAVIIYQMKIRIASIFKSILFFPNLLSPMVVGFVWMLMFSYRRGIINFTLRFLGLDNLAIEWLANTNTVLPSISVAILWFTLGYYLVIYTAGLTNIPRELYECAEIEGANGIQRLLKITLPMLVPSIKINVILSTIGAVAVFEIPKAMTNGGPGYYSQTVGLQVFSYAFGLRLPGRALALAVIMVIIALIITAFEWFYFKGKEDIQ